MKKKNKKQSHLHGYRKMASAGHELQESINALTLLEGKTDTRNTHWIAGVDWRQKVGQNRKLRKDKKAAKYGFNLSGGRWHVKPP